MTTADDRIRDAIRGEAEGYHVPADLWDRIVSSAAAGGRRGRARMVWLTAIAPAVAAVLAVAVVQLGRDRDDRVTTVPRAGHDHDDRAAVDDEHDGGSACRATEVVAYGDGEIVVVNASDGARVRVLVAKGSLAGVVHHLSLTDDHRTLYFDVVHEERCDANVYASRVDGSSPPKRLFHGHTPAVSPDGTRLAYLTPPASGCSAAGVVVRTLANGTERSFGIEGWEFERAPYGPLVWLDASRLLFSSSIPEGVGELFVLDLDSAEGLRDGPPDRPPDSALSGTSWDEPVFRAYDGSVGVLEHCCSLDAGTYDAGGPYLVVLDPATGAERGRLEPPFELGHFDYDASGRHLVAASDDGKLRLRSGGGAFRTIPGTFTFAVW